MWDSGTGEPVDVSCNLDSLLRLLYWSSSQVGLNKNFIHNVHLRHGFTVPMSLFIVSYRGSDFLTRRPHGV